MRLKITLFFLVFVPIVIGIANKSSLYAQDYFYGKYAPFDSSIPSPEAFLGYPIGDMHTRHDLIVAYLTELAKRSDRATITEYGSTHERRKLIILNISSSSNMKNLNSIKQQHLAFVDTDQNASNYEEIPVFINLAYNVHGNEPSSSEAALLAAYTLVASDHPDIVKYRENAIVFVDPTINPDGRDRHTQWANSFKGSPLVSDNIDAEHTEMWPRGRTNHYWFDLNRDWLLAVHPESQGKLNWYHQWYPNVVTDFHEMGTNSTYFFEPMKPIGSLDPLPPKANYEDLNDIFATYFSDALDAIGSFYFTKEAFDGTYPGYGSSYPDLQGALALLFEQASSRGHLQDTDYGTISFPFTIRNQYTSSFATIKAATENKGFLRKYQQEFFKNSIKAIPKSEGRNGAKGPKGIVAYEFGDPKDPNRTKAFMEKLAMHKIKTYQTDTPGRYVVPVRQQQKNMVLSVFETYDRYRDSVYYDASAWSVANFYNMKYRRLTTNPSLEKTVVPNDALTNIKRNLQKSLYAYLIDYNDYNATAALHFLQKNGLTVATAFQPFSATTDGGNQSFNYGALMIPVSQQSKTSDEIYTLLQKAQQQFNVSIYATNTGFSTSGIDLGSRNMAATTPPKAVLLIGDGVNSYEAGEVWHLLDTRVGMPITKVLMHNFRSLDLNNYNTLVMVSGNYSALSNSQRETIRDWVSAGNTLITIARATSWAINNEIVTEKLIVKEDDSTETKRRNYEDSRPDNGKQQVGGAIFEVDLDLTNPLGFGYTDRKLPVYKNNNVWLAPSENGYRTVAQYTEDAHIDGFISDKNRVDFLKKSASLVISRIGRGRAILFADNPNFRGSWYGTNKLFLNALFFGNLIN